MASAATLQPCTPNLASRFRQVFDQAGYSTEGLVATLGPMRLPAQVGLGAAHFRYLTRGGRPLDALIRLFLFGFPEDLDAARHALAPVPLEEWCRAGLIRPDDAQVCATVRILTYRDLLLACDQAPQVGTPPRSDLVMSITSSSTFLADFVVPRPSPATLDLGTGNGIQALLAAKHSERVWATDLNPRALEFARFNAAFNHRQDKIEFLEGKGFEPVRGMKFDLIVSNPPFAITPSVRYLFRDSGVAGDAFVRTLIADAARALNEGGFCQMVCDWAQIAGQDWKQRLAGWVGGLDCDAWIISSEVMRAADYANVWIGSTEYLTPQGTDRLYAEWLDYYQQQQIEAVHTGLIALRKASGRPTWLRIEELPVSEGKSLGEDVLRGFAASDFLASVRADDALLAAKMRVADNVRLDHMCGWEDSAWRIRGARIGLASALGYASNIDLRFADMVARCNGQRTVGEVLQQTAQAVGADVAVITPNCLNLIRQLVERGFLIPA